MVGKLLAHYRVIEKLGAGGMGEVYRAHDEQLGRDVAMKVLPASSFMDPAARARLLREARLAAALNHPHICTIHEVGEADGQVYIAMELIAGQPLQRAIPADGMPADQVLRLGLQIADAVAHAHAGGVVHRDLKTGNILVTPQGRAKVLDFGLAKRAIGDEPGDAPTTSWTSLTEAGTLVGTLPYMAPEQLRGQAADARSDVWSLGVMLYEMLAGARPFRGRTGLEVGSAILHQPAAPLPPNVTPDLKAVISRCLEKEPERRYQRAGELYAALEAIQTGAASPGAIRVSLHRLPYARLFLIAALLLVLTASWWGVTRRHAPPPRMDSIAVLPLANFTGDPGQQHFVDATHDGLIAELAQIGGLRVISRQSVLRYRETEKAIPEIARELDVHALVEGSVFRAGDSVRITVQLLQARPTERHLWAASFQRDLGGILTLHGEVARAIAERVEVAVTPAELRRLARDRPVEPAAYQTWLRGWVARWEVSVGHVERCILHAEEAAALDPHYAPAYVLAAECYNLKSLVTQTAPDEAFPKAKAAAQRAIELDASLGSAYAQLAIYLANYEWEWGAADRAYQRAIELAASDGVAHAYYGLFLAAMGRHDEAIEHARRAELLSPGLPLPRQYLAFAFFLARRYDEAINQAQRTIELAPNRAFAHFRLAQAYEGKGMYNEAVTAWERGVELSGDDVRPKGYLARAYGLAGRRNEASRILAEMLESEQTDYVPPTAIAVIYLGLGQLDEAMDWLEKAYEVRDGDLHLCKSFPGYDPLRSDERFQRLLRQMGFPQ